MAAPPVRFAGEYMPSELFSCKPDERTFMHDEELPPLPLPELSVTLKKYLESVQPHLSPDQLAYTRRVVAEFQRNEGPGLQEKLVERANTHRNWLDAWWHSYAYLKTRTPVAPDVNVCGMGPHMWHIWPPAAGTQLPRAALALHILMEHWQMLRRERLAIDSGKKGAEPWSMEQFRSLYSCCRIPRQGEDELVRHFKTEREGAAPTHIVVLVNGRIYRLETLDSSGAIFSPPQLESALAEIKADALSKGGGIRLSSLTGDDRDNWWKLRERLIELSHENGQNLEEIEGSVVALSLVDEAPVDLSQMARLGLLTKPGNNWFDKSYHMVWFSNGTTVSNNDHSPMDAMTSVMLCFYIDCRLTECQGHWEGKTTSTERPAFRELVFHVDDVILDGIRKAEKLYLKTARNVEIINPEFGHFGKTALRRLHLHPDTFVQVCLQYAYYKLHGRPAPTYETASTRKFYRARTETVRSCTNEALDFAKAMLDPKATPVYRLSLFKRAMEKHHSLMKECMNGQGIDRHLLGLMVTALEAGQPLPQLFTDPAYTKSGGGGNFVLSTSFVGFTSVHGGVIPMCKGGYGFFYRMGLERMIFFVSSWISDEETSAVRLYHAAEEAMIECLRLYQSQAASAL